MPPQVQRILIWAVSILGFTGALVGAAFLGIAMAKRGLPENAGQTPQDFYPVGVIVTVGAADDPVFFAGEVQPLRDFWFAHSTAEKRGAAEAGRGVTRLTGGIEVRTLGQDADVISVDVLTGEASGQTGWIHLSQLPPPQP